MPRCLGFGTKLGLWNSKEREIKGQLKENLSDLWFCLILCPVLSSVGSVWEFLRKGDYTGSWKYVAALNK